MSNLLIVMTSMHMINDFNNLDVTHYFSSDFLLTFLVKKKAELNIINSNYLIFTAKNIFMLSMVVKSIAARYR